MCVRPMNVKGNTVPCGKCFECKKQDRNNWSLRIQDEITEGLFLTLTYNEENNPKQLNKKHLIDFIKRLREKKRYDNKKHNQPNESLKYFASGEYGDKFGRPHYHIIINITNINDITYLWKYGHVHAGKISDSSIHYCTKYIQKNSGWKKDREKGKTPEFRIMSKGIGKKWIKKYGKWHGKHNITYRSKNGVIYGLPRYYKDKIFDKNSPTYRKQVDQNIENQLKKLMERYRGLLKSEIDENLRNKYLKYKKMYYTFTLLKQANLKFPKI